MNWDGIIKFIDKIVSLAAFDCGSDECEQMNVILSKVWDVLIVRL